MAIELELVLVNGERRTVRMPGHTDSIANALDRLDGWIATVDGGWVQKSFIVEVRHLDRGQRVPARSAEEFERLSGAAGTLADQR